MKSKKVYWFLFLCALQIQAQWLIPRGKGMVVRHPYYSVSYIEKYRQSEWAYYQLTAKMLRGTAKRKSNFTKDPLISEQQPSTNDYKKSGYDRGHLVPANDMKFSQKAMSATFYLSNISPQTPSFNRGIWKKLENRVRKWALKTKKLHIVTGGILNGKKHFIGENKVAVPRKFYKIIYHPDAKKMIGFIMPNEKSTANLERYIVSVDTIEKLTGIDFFWQLPDDLENHLEKQIHKFF